MSKFPTLKILNIALAKAREVEELLADSFEPQDFHDGDELVRFTNLKYDVTQVTNGLAILANFVKERSDA